MFWSNNIVPIVSQWTITVHLSANFLAPPFRKCLLISLRKSTLCDKTKVINAFRLVLPPGWWNQHSKPLVSFTRSECLVAVLFCLFSKMWKFQPNNSLQETKTKRFCWSLLKSKCSITWKVVLLRHFSLNFCSDLTHTFTCIFVYDVRIWMPWQCIGEHCLFVFMFSLYLRGYSWVLCLSPTVQVMQVRWNGRMRIGLLPCSERAAKKSEGLQLTSDSQTVFVLVNF